MLAADLKPRMWAIIGAMPELAERGMELRPSDRREITWARDLLTAMFPEFPAPAIDGLRAGFDDEVRAYRERGPRRQRRWYP